MKPASSRDIPKILCFLARKIRKVRWDFGSVAKSKAY